MNKCNKYEAYFLFSSEADFNKHLSECEDCRAEHEKFSKISALVKEVEPAYTKRKSINLMTKVACISVLMMFTFSYGILSSLNNMDDYKYVSYSEDSVIENMGLPVDGYGLLQVD